MIKLLLYIGVLIGLCYILDYFWQKWIISLREIKEAYIDLKEAEKDLQEFLNKK
jgi:hypothetical protein